VTITNFDGLQSPKQYSQTVQLILDKFYWHAFLDLLWEFGAVVSKVGLMALLGFSRQGRSTCRELHQVWERSPAWPTAACHNQLPFDCHTGCRHYIGVPWRQLTTMKAYRAGFHCSSGNETFLSLVMRHDNYWRHIQGVSKLSTEGMYRETK